MTTGAARGVDTASRFLGCMLGGAVGDALGAPIEFLPLDQIRLQIGLDSASSSNDPLKTRIEGVRRYLPAYGRIGAVTDDTQMSMFTAEGLIRAHNAALARGDGDPFARTPAPHVHRAYLRWLDTQRLGAPPPRPDGWLASLGDLYHRRAPGNTCLSSLRTGIMGTMERPINNSKGCGGVMRVAPLGLAGWPHFVAGCEVAAITHTHPVGYLASGFLAMVIAEIVGGETLVRAVDRALRALRQDPNGDVIRRLVERAMYLAEDGDPEPEKVEQLGQGWIAEEALAMGLYCAAVVDEFAHGVGLAVLHGGDSDSTGAIAGHLLGAMHGVGAIPVSLLDPLELRDEIATLARDLYAHFGVAGFAPSEDDWLRYPG